VGFNRQYLVLQYSGTQLMRTVDRIIPIPYKDLHFLQVFVQLPKRDNRSRFVTVGFAARAADLIATLKSLAISRGFVLVVPHNHLGLEYPCVNDHKQRLTPWLQTPLN
jgi:hypothetical protein